MTNSGRTFGQDIMRGEHTLGGGKLLLDNKVRLAPGGGGGGAWLGGPKTASSDKFTATPAGLLFGEDIQVPASGTSIFDPVLTELCYRWFVPKGGIILDPFAGGSVRGIVASVLGFHYEGFELRPEQVAANREQAADICTAFPPIWHVGDSAAAIPQWDGAADFLFSCPPYGDLEVYSDEPADLSAMPHANFLASYRVIIAASVAKLKPNSFAAFVVGDFRCKKGFYRNFIGETVAAFEAAGARFYNEAILVTAVGSLPVRVGKQFAAARKLGKTHQNCLVFVKGDPKAATAKINGAAA
jgi:hypothetical protein